MVLSESLRIITGLALALGLLARGAVAVPSFNLVEANKHLWASSASYCDPSVIPTRTFKGPTAGFVVTKVISQSYESLGYIGYLPSDSSIFVTFRGNTNTNNWLASMQLAMTTYSGNCCSMTCKVHTGMNSIANAFFPTVLQEVQRLKALYPTYSVKLTGHSQGGAIASLIAFALKNSGISAAAVYTFGQPRVGDSNFATCMAQKIPLVRVTHLKDVVPHVPYQSFGFRHAVREAYESSTTTVSPVVKDCSSTNGEDTSCAAQWGNSATSVVDHRYYLGLYISQCSSVS